MTEKIRENKNITTSKLIGKDKTEELSKILSFGEKYKSEGERLKREFWNNHTKKDLEYLLASYDESLSNFINGLEDEERIILERLEGISKEKFFDEYIRNYILYGTKIEDEKKKAECIKYDLENIEENRVVMKEGKYILIELGKNQEIFGILKDIIRKIKLKEGVYLNLKESYIGDIGADILTKNIETSEGSSLNLSYNNIGFKGIKTIAENLELKEGMFLDLSRNRILKEGAEILSQKMKLKKNVKIDISGNGIGDEGAESIINNLELQDGVILDLSSNGIEEELKKKLKERELSYKSKGIYCEIII